MFIHSYYVSGIIISKDIVSIFPTTKVHISLKKALPDDCTVRLKVIEHL
jgi:hypothetical protein